MNSVNIIGRITKDPELRDSLNNKKYVAFSVAVSEYNSGKQKTQFIPCFIWDKAAENLVRYVKKGNLLAIEGSIVYNNTLKDGKYTTNMHVNVKRIEYLWSTFDKNNREESLSINDNKNDYIYEENEDMKYNINDENFDEDDEILWEN